MYGIPGLKAGTIFMNNDYKNDYFCSLTEKVLYNYF